MLILPKTLIFTAAIILLSGCAALNEPQKDTNAVTTDSAAGTPTGQLAMTQNPSETDINWLLRYYRSVNNENGEQLSDDYEKTKIEFLKNRTAKNQWKLAILLSIPGTSFYDAGRSSELFKELTNNDLEHDTQLNDAAFLMHTLASEQYRTGKKLSALEAQLAEAQAANKTLQDKISALKAIEDAINQRKAEEKPKP